MPRRTRQPHRESRGPDKGPASFVDALGRSAHTMHNRQPRWRTLLNDARLECTDLKNVWVTAVTHNCLASNRATK